MFKQISCYFWKPNLTKHPITWSCRKCSVEQTASALDSQGNDEFSLWYEVGTEKKWAGSDKNQAVGNGALRFSRSVKAFSTFHSSWSKEYCFYKCYTSLHYYTCPFVALSWRFSYSASALRPPPGHSTDGGEAGRVHSGLLSGERPPAGRWRPQLHPPPDSWAGQGLLDQIPRGPHHLSLLLWAAGEPGEAASGCEFDLSIREHEDVE